MNNLGVCYQHGFGCVRNLNLAFEKFRGAAERGYVISLSNCGYMKELGLGTDLDEEEALRYYRSAAARECVEAAYNLGRLYIFTKTFYNDFALGRETLHKAAKMGSGDAWNLLGCIAYKGFKVERDYDQARELFLQAARLGNAAALNNLAWLYQHGYGVPMDLAKAVHYYADSAARGYSSAECNLGFLYFHGLGVEENMPRAFELFTQAVGAENTTAMFNLALLHLDPNSGYYDTARAASLLKKCALEGFAEAKDLLDEIRSNEARGA
jgi:TPR repeat protein